MHPGHVTVNAAAQRADPDSVLAFYRELIRLRHDEPIVTDGDYRLLLPDHPSLWAYLRSTPTESWLVVANLSGESVELPADARVSDGVTVLSTVPGEQGSTAQPWEARVAHGDLASARRPLLNRRPL